MHHVLARITVKPESAQTARGILLDLVAHSRQEPGCVSYELYQQAGNPHVFQTVEQWRDEAAADQHLRTIHVGAALAAATPLLAAPPEIQACTKLA